MTPGRHVIIGTAGHIDHGKTALVKALTGIETDTHPQERARGLTIDVGFAYWKEDVTLLDVPGHERFVKNAVAGVSSVDLALFVVAADDGVMPQTREHLAILRLLGVRDGLVALTKTDLVEPEWVEMVVEDLRELLAGTFLEAAEIVPVSSVTGEGIGRLRALLEERIAGVGPRSDRGVLRLPVDRAFSMSGFGTVVTGTVLAGSVRPRDELVLQPRGRPVRVRGVQVHGRDVAAAGAGSRAAVNLSDVNVADVARGDTLAEPGFFVATSLIDAHLRMLEDAPAVLKHRDRLRLHLGPGEVLARVVLLDADALAPGKAASCSSGWRARGWPPTGTASSPAATRRRGPWPGVSSSIPGPAGTGGGGPTCSNGWGAWGPRIRGRCSTPCCATPAPTAAPPAIWPPSSDAASPMWRRGCGSCAIGVPASTSSRRAGGASSTPGPGSGWGRRS